MKTKYVKIAMSDRTPPENEMYMTSHGWFIWNNDKFVSDDALEIPYVNYWLEEVPDAEYDLREQVKKLQAFKDYVHKRLDDAGVAKEPCGKHSEEGCRIGDRLDIVLAAANKDWMKAFEEDYNKRYKNPPSDEPDN